MIQEIHSISIRFASHRDLSLVHVFWMDKLVPFEVLSTPASHIATQNPRIVMAPMCKVWAWDHPQPYAGFCNRKTSCSNSTLLRLPWSKSAGFFRLQVNDKVRTRGELSPTPWSFRGRKADPRFALLSSWLEPLEELLLEGRLVEAVCVFHWGSGKTDSRTSDRVGRQAKV